MWEHSLGNSVSMLYNKLCEQHSEDRMERSLQFLTVCVTTSRAPTTKWLLFIHTEDVWSQYGELKAKVTSVFGSICLEEWFNKKVKLLITQRQKGGSWSNSKASWALQMSCLPAGSAQLAQHCGCYMWRRGDRAADWRDTEGPQGSQGNHGHPFGGLGEDGRHLGQPKGGLTLPVYCCARGSTSLESFHNHLNRLIPGKIHLW